MPYILQVSSSEQLVVYPDYSSKFSAAKMEDRHRSRSGNEFVYKWAEYGKEDIKVTFVDSEFKSIVNSWWSTNVVLQWYPQGSTDVTTVRIVGKDQPIDKLMKPYTDLFQGGFKLEEVN